MRVGSGGGIGEGLLHISSCKGIFASCDKVLLSDTIGAYTANSILLPFSFTCGGCRCIPLETGIRQDIVNEGCDVREFNVCDHTTMEELQRDVAEIP
jgi:hypothetical protein